MHSRRERDAGTSPASRQGHIGSFGGEGEGPSEFVGPSTVVSQGDSIVVVDARMLRFHDLTWNASLGTALSLSHPACFLHGAVSLSDGLVGRSPARVARPDVENW